MQCEGRDIHWEQSITFLMIYALKFVLLRSYVIEGVFTASFCIIPFFIIYMQILIQNA